MRSLRGERRAVAVTAASLAIVLAARSTLAADTEPVRVRFEAPDGCPGEAAFLEQVRARTAKARVAAAGEKARTFAVRLMQEGRLIRGRLAIEEPASQTEIREVTGERCAEVVSALALITALAVDPQASTAPPARLPTAPPVANSPTVPMGSSGAAPGGSSSPAAPPPPRAQLPPNHPAPYLPPRSWADLDVFPLPVVPGSPADDSPRWRFSVGIEVAALGGFAPLLASGSALYLEAARDGEGVLAFAPSIRLAAIQADSGYVGPAQGGARFQLRMGRAELCPVRVRFLPGVSIAPCTTFEVGAIFAEGWGSGGSGSSQRPWVAPGLGGRVRWAITEEIELQIAGGGSLPLVRDTFFIAVPDTFSLTPDIDVHAVPAATGWLAGGVGVHFY